MIELQFTSELHLGNFKIVHALILCRMQSTPAPDKPPAPSYRRKSLSRSELFLSYRLKYSNVIHSILDFYRYDIYLTEESFIHEAGYGYFFTEYLVPLLCATATYFHKRNFVYQLLKNHYRR